MTTRARRSGRGAGPRDSAPPRWLRAGFLADGCFKLLVAGGYAVFGSGLADLLLTPPWLIGTTAALVGASGIAEIAFAVRRGTRSHVGVLAGYDGTWLLVTAIGWLIGGSAGGGSLWFGYQAIGSAVLTAVFARAARQHTTSGAGARALREPADG